MLGLGGGEVVALGGRMGQSPLYSSGVGREPSKSIESPLGPQTQVSLAAGIHLIETV